MATATFAADAGDLGKNRSVQAQHARSAAPAGNLSRELASYLKHSLDMSVRGGKRAIVARVFDNVRDYPALRDVVLDHARILAPGFARELTNAADPGVLTAGQRLVLAPNAAAFMASRSAMPNGNANAAMSRGSAAASVNYAPAVAATPSLPSPVATQSEQTWHLDAIHASEAYQRNYTGAGVNVAVADTGYDTDNKALAPKLLTGLGRNYVIPVVGQAYDPSQIGLLSPTDMHGTHVAGIIAATKYDTTTYPNYFMHGVAYDANIIPLRMLVPAGGASAVADASASALTYFASLPNSGATGSMVYNASYGPDTDGLPPQNVWSVGAGTSEYEAALAALKAGKIIVAANGNDRQVHPVAGANPSGLALMPFIEPGHANKNVYDDHGENLDFSALKYQPGQMIAVMAIAQDKTAATYSNLCGVAASWCVAGTGGDTPHDKGIYSTFPGDTYGYADGTSMATPSVSGAIAVLISAYPTYNAHDLSRLLFSTAEDLGLPGVDAVFGHGLIRLDRATDGPTTLAANHTETVADQQTTYWSQPLPTSGAFSKDGLGTLVIAGRTVAGGDVSVDGGTLAVDGALTVTGHSLLVQQTGTLAGFGEINGNTTIGGTLSPGKMPNIQDLVANGTALGSIPAGNSAGTLSFYGNVTLTATAITRVDVDGTLVVPGGHGTYDKIYVFGAGNAFVAGGTLTPVLRNSVGTPSNYTPTIGSHFRFVEAFDGAQTLGSFAALTQPSSGLDANTRFDLIYSPTSITLTVTPLNFAGMGTGLTPQQQQIANILDANRPDSGAAASGASKSVFDALYSLNSEADYSTALTQLANPGQASATGAMMTGFSGFMGSVSDRQNAVVVGSAGSQTSLMPSVAFAYAGGAVTAQAQGRDAFASLDPTPNSNVNSDGWGVWGRAFGRWSSVSDQGALAGSNTRSGGFTVGADSLLAPDLMSGVAFGFVRSINDSAGSRGTADSYVGALYASWTPGRAVVDVRAAMGPSTLKTTRTTVLSSAPIEGSANAFGGGFSAEAGYIIPIAYVDVKPYAGIAYQALRRNSYAETQPLGLSYSSQTFEKLTTTLGVSFSKVYRTEGATLLPEIKLGWGHDLRDTALVSQAALLDNPFTVNAANPGRDAMLLGIKVSGWTQENFRVFGAYDGEYRVRAVSHQMTGGARYTW